MLYNAKTLNELNEILSTNEKVIIDFYADWCGPCKLMLPKFTKLAEDDKIVGVKVNVEDASELTHVYKIRSIPVLAYIKNGELITKTVGAKEENEILETFLEL